MQISFPPLLDLPNFQLPQQTTNAINFLKILLHFLNIQANMYIDFIPFPTFFFTFFTLNKHIRYRGRLLRIPWTARSNQSILKEISPEYSLEGLMLKLKLQYFGHLMGRTDSCEKTLMVGKTEGEGEGDDRG